MTSVISLLGILLLLAVAYALSSRRKAIKLRTVGGAFALQFLLGAVVLYIPYGKRLLELISYAVAGLLGYAQAGIEFLFGDIGAMKLGFIFAFHVLPVVIFFSSLVTVLYYLGVMGWIIRIIGGALASLLHTGKAESMSATANIFVGQTEAPLVIKPFLPRMTRSELFAVMVGGLATVAGSVLAGYVGLGVDLKYLLAASFMAAPGGFLMAKLLQPEIDTPEDNVELAVSERKQYVNVLDAAAGGASAGLRLAVNIAAMLMAFVALIAMFNGFLAWIGGLINMPFLSLQYLLGLVFRPLAFILGIPWSESGIAGSLIGQKLVLNEFVAYIDFAEKRALLSEHTQAVVTIALCGFANLSSIAITIGGISSLAPSRRKDIAQLGVRALIAAFMANLMSAAIASFFLSLT